MPILKRITLPIVVLLVILALFLPSNQVAHADAPVYSTVTVGGIQYRYVRVRLNDNRTGIQLMSADSAVPKRGPNNSYIYASGQWFDNGSHQVNLLDMYNAYGSSASYKKAAINGDFFRWPNSNGAPLGDFIRAGVKYQYNDNVNEPGIGAHSVMRIGYWDGTRYPVSFVASTNAGMGATNARTAIGGTNRMSKVGTTSTWNMFPQGNSISDTRRGQNLIRSGVCTTSDNNTLYLVVSASAGTAVQLKDAFNTLGCNKGMELDGGGSSTLVYGGQVKYGPTPLRAIADGILIQYFPNDFAPATDPDYQAYLEEVGGISPEPGYQLVEDTWSEAEP